eukprot:TRINITY_DN26428_c0_g2_i1.p1 TRINITY_DN26428_c0_g2~~TRINITY_DN26428_c0_g2_i1.p1  ORF type:complete len:162 (+),score=35.61 TRINITY_DN26428_c0_g2_i1:68-553(+)
MCIRDRNEEISRTAAGIASNQQKLEIVLLEMLKEKSAKTSDAVQSENPVADSDPINTLLLREKSQFRRRMRNCHNSFHSLKAKFFEAQEAGNDLDAIEEDNGNSEVQTCYKISSSVCMEGKGIAKPCEEVEEPTEAGSTPKAKKYPQALVRSKACGCCCII